MIFIELDNGLFEGMPEEGDDKINLPTFDKLVRGLAKTNPSLLGEMARQGFKSLSPEESKILQERIESLTGEGGCCMDVS